MPIKIVLMGVSGCGKTTIGNCLAEETGSQFKDGDWFHSPQNREKMGAGIPLTDEDRKPWLNSLMRVLESEESIILACSALKYTYRKQLRQCEQTSKDKIQFVHLVVPESILLERLTARAQHYFPPELLTSQLQCLESGQDDEVIVEVDNTKPTPQVIQIIKEALDL